MTVNQLQKITSLGAAKAEGRRVLVTATGPGGVTLRAFYTVETPSGDRLGHDDLWLIPVAESGSIARSAADRSSYAFTHGGAVYRAAVGAAKDLASAWGLPTE